MFFSGKVSAMHMLKPRYEQFCRHYLGKASGYEAAVGAGYSRKSAYVTGCRLLARPEIIARIQELRRQITLRESLNVPALLMKLETAYAQAVAAKNPLAIVRVIELQAKIAGLVGAKREGGLANDDEIEREIAALEAEERPTYVKPRERKPVRKQAKGPSSPEPVVPAPAANAEPVVMPPILMPIVGHDEPPPALPSDDIAASDDVETPDEELRRQEIRRLALEAVSRSRTRKRLRLSA